MKITSRTGILIIVALWCDGAIASNYAGPERMDGDTTTLVVPKAKEDRVTKASDNSCFEHVKNQNDQVCLNQRNIYLQEAISQNSKQQIKEITTIKNWITFWSVLNLIGLGAAIILIVTN